MEQTLIRVRQWYLDQKNLYHFVVSTYNSDTNQPIENVNRNITELESLSYHINKIYGGHVIPILESGRNLMKDHDAAVGKIEDYLNDMRENSECRRDKKFYCFVFESAMTFKAQEIYTKVLSSASNISRKYLNTIFTRKQLPQEKSAHDLVKSYEKLQPWFQNYQNMREIAVNTMMSERCVQEIKSIFSQISGFPCWAALPQENKMIQGEKVIKRTDKFIIQTKQAFSRWQILVQGVRELQNNVYKGLHEDVSRLETRSNQLKEWTQSLREELIKLSGYFEGVINYLGEFVVDLKFDCIMTTLLSDEQFLITNTEEFREEQDIAISNHSDKLDDNKDQNVCNINQQKPKQQILKREQIQGMGTDGTLSQPEILYE